MLERGLTWYEWQELYPSKLRTPASIAAAEISTHNHFVLNREVKIFKNSAPVIKLAENASKEDYLHVLGLLNSSTACFWLRQVSHPKSGSGIGRGVQDEPWENRYVFNTTALEKFPLPSGSPLT